MNFFTVFSVIFIILIITFIFLIIVCVIFTAINRLQIGPCKPLGWMRRWKMFWSANRKIWRRQLWPRSCYLLLFRPWSCRRGCCCWWWCCCCRDGGRHALLGRGQGGFRQPRHLGHGQTCSKGRFVDSFICLSPPLRFSPSDRLQLQIGLADVRPQHGPDHLVLRLGLLFGIAPVVLSVLLGWLSWHCGVSVPPTRSRWGPTIVWHRIERSGRK